MKTKKEVKNKNLEFTKQELKILKSLNTPKKIQDFINKIPINFEEDKKDTCLSPIQVLRKNKSHCIEGAIFAAFCFQLQGKKPLLVDMKTTKDDFEHVIAVFKKDNFWGAISKTNHAVLRYREPIYKSIRELVMSYFHEYFKDNGKKTLRSFSNPVNLNKFKNWEKSEKDLWLIHNYLDKIKHHKILNNKQIKNLRKADKIEIQAGKLTEYKNPKLQK